MKKFRESNFLDGIFFNGNRDPSVYTLLLIINVLVGTISCLAMTAGPLYLNPAIVVPLVFSLATLIVFGIPNLGRLHVLNSLEDSHGRYYNGPRLRERGLEYLSLSTADRGLYPVNILDIIKNPDLSQADKIDLNSTMKDIYDSIVERDSKKAELARQMRVKNVNIDDIVSRLQDSHGSIKAETSVWNEELSRVKDERRLGIN